MKQNFASRYASMSDEQLKYEASQSDGFTMDARVAMRQEFDKRGWPYDNKLSDQYDDAQSGEGPQQTLGQFLEKHPVLSFFGASIIIRMTYKLFSASFGG